MDGNQIQKMLDRLNEDDLSDDDSVADPNFEVDSDIEDESDFEVDIYDASADVDSSGDDEESPAEEIDEFHEVQRIEEDDPPFSAETPIEWINVSEFVPRFTPSSMRACTIMSELSRNSSPLEIFSKLFPQSLIIHITHCTNKRLEALARKKKKEIKPTNIHEMKSLLGCILVMCYNVLPHMNCYWSTKQSMGNALLKKTISRDRFKLLISKLYFAEPEKPAGASKLYYIEDVISCLKLTFQKARQDSPYQSIDESMTKFKRRSARKHYLPLKPVKRGIKVWIRCDALTGYTYDWNIYGGKENTVQQGTLGERVVRKLCDSITEKDVTVAFDRFFTSVHLMDTLPFAAVGTCIKNRKNLPDMQAVLARGEAEFSGNNHGTIAARWIDTKEVLVLSNCHDARMTEVKKKQKDGTTKQYRCPDSIAFYRKIMSGVGVADQMPGVYNFNRKSLKWWKKVFYRCILFASVNAWIIYKELRHHPQKPFLDFIVDLSEDLIEAGQKSNPIKRSLKQGRRSKRAMSMTGVGLHMPVEGKTRRRCKGCADKGQEKRTKVMCNQCQLPYCMKCFEFCHN